MSGVRRKMLMLSILAPLVVLSAPVYAQARDGAHDFDWEFGRWATSLRYLANPLSGDPDRWIEYRGTTIVRPALDGQMNLAELDVGTDAGARRIRGVSLRLYNPDTRQWSLNFAGAGSGQVSAPVFGGFDAAGKGLFYGQDNVEGRVVMVRFMITPESRDIVRFVQSYSVDAGATWQDNWIAVDHRR